MAKEAMTYYLRRERRTSGLTQPELADLIGCRCAIQLSRIERGLRPPSLHILVASKILFDCPTRKTFPRLYDEVEETVMRLVYRLYEKLEDQKTPRAKQKREFLEQVLGRAIENNNKYKAYAKKDVS